MMATKRAPAGPTPKGLHLRSNEQWVTVDGANLRHIADTDSELWVKYGAPICGARAVSVSGGFIPTEAKLDICHNCLADH